MALEPVLSPTALHPALGFRENNISATSNPNHTTPGLTPGTTTTTSTASTSSGINKVAGLPRPRPSSSHSPTSSNLHHLSLNTARASRHADDPNTPSTAHPALGGSSWSLSAAAAAAAAASSSSSASASTSTSTSTSAGTPASNPTLLPSVTLASASLSASLSASPPSDGPLADPASDPVAADLAPTSASGCAGPGATPTSTATPAAISILTPTPTPTTPTPHRRLLSHRRNASSQSSSLSQPSHGFDDVEDSVPRQTIIKALASVRRNNKPQALPLGDPPQQPPPRTSDSISSSAAAMLFPQRGIPVAPGSASSPSSQRLADALHDLARRRSTPSTAFTAMQSPCFYHNRFDDAVDLDKVLEDIKNDESMSHSRLVQTATSVREVSKQLQRQPIRRAVRNIMIVTKARDTQLVYLTRELATWLLRTPRYGSPVGVNVYVDAKLRSSKRFDAPGIVAQDDRFTQMLRYWTPDLCWTEPEKFDLVLTLGGDGTVLFTSWLFQRIVPPVLSFSLGSLGFMTTFEFDKYKEHLNRVMGDDGMKINLRMRFTCTVWRNGRALGSESAADEDGTSTGEGEQFEVLNELVIDRGPSPYVSNLELYGDDELLTVVQADGCIFSTPTGSTAYSLSAGGSLVHPDIPAILLTPICPHTLSFRPMVLSDTMALRVAVPHNSRATAYCAFDGKGRVELRQGDHVTITASQYPFPTVTRTDTEWFNSVSRTLRWNVRVADQKPFGGPGLLDGDGADPDDDAANWDIDTDSACYASEEGSVSASPIRRQMSMLGL